MSRPRVLLLQPSLQPVGGGNGVAVWMIEALKEDHDITLLGWDRVDLDAINRYYGTKLREGDFAIRYVPRWSRLLGAVPAVRGALLQRYLMLRWGRPLAADFDVTLSVNGEIDVGVRAVQYVHYPWGYLPRPDADLRWFHRLPGVLPLYYALGAAIAPVSEEAIRRNLTLVNSDWTGGRFRERYGSTPTTLYPPVFGSLSPLPWEDRDNAFVSLGRVAREKNLEMAIAIMERVREAGHPVTLRLIGSGSPHDRYLRTVQRLVEKHEWIELHLNIAKHEVLDLIAKSRYGIHAMTEEHFGIAVAEMASSGCIVFARRGGGVTEILNDDDRVLYESVEDAATKIIRVLDSRRLQDELRAVLMARAETFSYEAFRARFRTLIARFLERV
jgi:glycosyltransferase involved in cell wall biosynthesis